MTIPVGIAPNPNFTGSLAAELHQTKGLHGKDAADVEPGYVALTVEALIAQCKATMNQLDTDLRSKMDGQKMRNDQLAALGELSTLVANAPKVPAGKEGDQTTEGANNGKLLAEDGEFAQLNQLEKNHPELKEQIDAVRDKIAGGLTSDEAKACMTTIDNASDKLRSDNETTMIEIQSLVSKRGQSLQMTSNIANSINESAKGVLQNIR